MKRIIILLSLLATFGSCTKENIVFSEIAEDETSSNAIQFFNSPEALWESISKGEDDCITTKAARGTSFSNLFTSLTEVDIESDPILSYEAKKRFFEGKETIYKALGYDELVPNENFARLLNTHGEFRVGDFVYKVSPRGTYFFPESGLEQFEANYAAYENMEGELVKEKTYLIAPSVYRYDTFAGVVEEEMMPETKVNPIPYYNWSQAETHQGSANEVFENQIFYKEFQWNVRMKTRVYNHDYVVYQERGAYVKTQNKTWIGWWADKTATGLGLGWNNIIMTKPYNGLNGPILSVSPTFYGISNEQFNGSTVSVYTIFAYSIPEADYPQIVSGNIDSLRSFLLNRTGLDIIGHDAVRLIGPEVVQTIFPADYRIGQNIDEIKIIFSDNVMAPSYKFAAGQFFYVGQDNDLLVTMRVGTSF